VRSLFFRWQAVNSEAKARKDEELAKDAEQRASQAKVDFFP